MKWGIYGSGARKYYVARSPRDDAGVLRMSAVLYLIAMLFALGGGAALVFGYDLVTTERGLALTIGGAVALTGAAVVLGLGMTAQRLGRIARALEAAAFPSFVAPGPADLRPTDQLLPTDLPAEGVAALPPVLPPEGSAAALATSMLDPPHGAARPTLELDALTADIEREIGEVAAQKAAPDEARERASGPAVSGRDAPSVDQAPRSPAPVLPERDTPSRPPSVGAPPAEAPPGETGDPSVQLGGGAPESVAGDLAAPPPSASQRQVIGSYAVGSNTYTMFADGSVEAITDHGVFQFASLDELKDFIEKGELAKT